MLFKAIFAGILYFLSFPPFDYWYLIFPAIYYFYSSIIQVEKVFTKGFIFGSIAYGVILFGIQSIGYEAWVPLTILMGLMYGLFSKLLAFIGTKTNYNLFALIGVISGFGLLRSYFPFGGFPWGYSSTVLLTGYQDNIFFYFVPKIFKTFGPIGYSLLIESLILFLYLLIRNRNNSSVELKRLPILLVFLIVPLVFTTLSTVDSPIKEIEVSIIQGNSPCPGAKNKCEDERQRIYDNHLLLTKSLESKPKFKDEIPRLILWAESSSGFKNDPKNNAETLKEIISEVERLNAAILIGGDRPSAPGEFENYGIFINENGKIGGEYLKQHPVPFGEYIPFRKYLDWIPPLSLVPRDMVRGTQQEVFSTNKNDIKISTVISFEGSFDRYIRNSVIQGAEVVVILTNQASYGKSGMSDQFILMSRANAISNNRDIAHAAITGKSAFISGIDGEIYSSTGLFMDAVLTEKIKTSNTVTLYTRWGNYLNYLLILFGILSLFWPKNTLKKN